MTLELGFFLCGVCYFWSSAGLRVLRDYESKFNRKTERRFIATIMWPYLMYELVKAKRL